MDIKADLLTRADAYCAEHDISRSRLAGLVVDDGKFFTRISGDGSFTARTYERFLSFFADPDAFLAKYPPRKRKAA